MVDAVVKSETDLAWNDSLCYAKVKRQVVETCRVTATLDVYGNFTTFFTTCYGSYITTVGDFIDCNFVFGDGPARVFLLKNAGIDPRKDLALSSFYNDRVFSSKSDERDVV